MRPDSTEKMLTSMPPFPPVYRTAIRMGIIGNLPGKTPEATMASALYTDIKKWKDGKAGSVFCRWVHVPAIPPAPASLRKVGPKFQIPITFFGRSSARVRRSSLQILPEMKAVVHLLTSHQ